MERGIAEMDLETVDQMVQVHGMFSTFPGILQLNPVVVLDYEGVGMSSRDANSKKAAAEATAIFQNYYPEFLVRIATSKQVLCCSLLTSIFSTRSSSSMCLRS